MTTSNIVLVATATSTALISGLFYSYSCSVNLGLGQLSDNAYLMAMQSINRAILNPVFFMSFMGTLILLPVSTWLSYSQNSASTYILLAATVIYIVGAFGVTMFGNVPLNESLDAVNLSSQSINEIAHQRIIFEGPWNRLHTIRTLSSVVSLVLVIIACINNSRSNVGANI